MKKSLNLKSLVLSMAVAAGSVAAIAPATVQADVEYNASVSNFYLLRGKDISEGQGVVSGGVDYSHDSGLYVGMWTSSEAGGSEFDLYGGYAAEFGGFGIDLGYIAYLYPSDTGADASMTTDIGEMLAEYMLGISYADFGATLYVDTQGDDNGNCKYLSLDYGLDKFGFHYGMSMNDDSAAEYTDVNVSYAATDNFTITVSKAMGDGVKGAGENPMINIAYSLPM